MTPANAPASIMPSRPTAKTPARSERMPPSDAKSSGVAIRSAAARSSAATSIGSDLRAAGGQAHRRQDEDHRQSLDDRDQGSGNADGPLHGERPRLEESEEEAGRQDRDRVERAQQRDRHRVEAEAVREAVDQAVMHAEHLDGAGEPGER